MRSILGYSSLMNFLNTYDVHFHIYEPMLIILKGRRELCAIVAQWCMEIDEPVPCVVTTTDPSESVMIFNLLKIYIFFFFLILCP